MTTSNKLNNQSASPQLEDGYTRIANELLEIIARTDFSPYESRVFWCVVRKTYGFHKKMDKLSIGQINKLTNISRSNISKTLKVLCGRNILLKKPGGYITEYGVQKDHSKWLDRGAVLADSVSQGTVSGDTGVVSPQILGSVPANTETSVPADTHKINKENIPKETIQNIYMHNDKPLKNVSNNKKPYGEELNVFLTDEEFAKLEKKFGHEEAMDKINYLSYYIGSKGDKYKSHYMTILYWEAKENKEGGHNGKTGGYSGKPKPVPGNEPAGALDDIITD